MKVDETHVLELRNHYGESISLEIKPDKSIDVKISIISQGFGFHSNPKGFTFQKGSDIAGLLKLINNSNSNGDPFYR